MKCLKKHVKEEIIMWWHMHFFRNAPKSKMFIFCFSIETPHFRNAPLLYVRFIWHARFSHLILWIGKVGHFKLNFRHFEKTHISYIINSSFTCFLEHFMFPRKQSIADWQIDHLFAKFNKKTFIALQLSDQ